MAGINPIAISQITIKNWPELLRVVPKANSSFYVPAFGFCFAFNWGDLVCVYVLEQ